MELRIRPKSDYMHQANLQELYILTEHWQADVRFYKDELRFLRDLVDKYFMWLIEKEHIDNLQEKAGRLLNADKQCDELAQKITKHLTHLNELQQNAFSHDEQQFRNEHGKLEDEIADFAKLFRDLKKDVFKITEEVLESEKLKHLLTE